MKKTLRVREVDETNTSRDVDVASDENNYTGLPR